MAKINLYSQLAELTKPGDYQRYSSALLQVIITELNGALDFVKNVRASGPFVLGFTATTQVITVSHNLGRVPTGILPVKLSASSVLYAAGATLPWTSEKIYLQASAGVTATIFVI